MPPKLLLSDIEHLAQKRGGKLLSKYYYNNTTPLQFECKFGHLFLRKVKDLKSDNTWCPKCSVFRSEEICRLYCQAIFKHNFPKIKLSQLKSIKGRKLELDGYCAELNLAFEHQGRQHYVNNSKFRDLDQVRENDRLKLNQCQDLGIKLIIIPELFTLTKLNNLKNVILDQGQNFITYDFDENDLDLSEAFNDKNRIYYSKFKDKVDQLGGQLISQTYIGAYHKLSIRCSNNHLFKKTWNDLKKDSWCPCCAIQKRSR